MITYKKLLNTMKKYVGTKENPTNSNNVCFNTHYYGHSVKGSAYPWCCVFVWDMFRLSGGGSQFCDGKKVAYCPDVENYYKKKGKWFKSGKVGDLCLMDFGKGRASHIGVVVEVLGGGKYKTIEGNTSTSSNDNGGCVMFRTRSTSVIRGFARPDYKKENTKKLTSGYYKKCSSKCFSLVDGLQEIKADSSYSKRCKIAKKNGIENYKGSSSQNDKMLKMLKNGKLKKA